MPVSLDKFYWDDLARAGDKIPRSPDDKECGDHFIAIDRDCHDGKANRPEPGENPYWTGPNSAEERRKRGVPLEETKPSIPPEEIPPEEAPPEEAPPEEDPDEMRRWANEQARRRTEQEREAKLQPIRDKWNKKNAELQQRRETLTPRELHPDSVKNYGKRMRGALTDLGNMAVLTYVGHLPYPGSDKQTPGEQVEDWLRVNEQIKNWKKFQPKDQAGIDELSSRVRELLEHLDVAAGPELREGRLKNLSGGTTEFESFELRIKQMEILLDQYENDKYATSNPQDILAWEKLKRSPEYLQKEAINTLHSVTEIPGFKFKGIDPSNMSPGDQQYVNSKLRSLELWFSQWKHNPKSGMGGYLAEKLLGGAEQLGPHIDESPLEPNPEAARIIAEISARAGEENSNDLLWEKFGLSEEWTPTSFQHDYKKAAKKAIKAVKKELGFDIAAFAKENRALDKLERAAKAMDKKHQPEYVALMKKRLALQKQHNQGLINDIEYNREKEILKDQLAIQANEARQREMELEDHRSSLRGKVEVARRSLHQSLTQANAETAARPETIDAVLGRLDNPMWRDMSTDSPATDSEGDITPKAQQDFDRLQAMRQEHRRSSVPGFILAREIKDSLSRVLGWLHRDLLEGPEGVMLKELNWESEFSFRARANEEANSITLDRSQTGAVAAHEFGHHLEFRNKRVKARILDLYNERTEGIEAEWIKGYEPHERFKQPKTKGKRFFTDYASKFYPNRKGEQGDTELLSLGLEALENEDKFRQLLRYDPEHLAIILATIRGY